MKELLRWALAGAIVGVITGPPVTRRPRPEEELTKRAAAGVLELVLLDAELRGATVTRFDHEQERCSCGHCRETRARFGTALRGPITPGDATVPAGDRLWR